ncbi:hypothetical protein BQ8420_00575 [Nocardiopsis sp. JB363]|nr:hypothetical protein BQ8420_00575 [Nocardiopsis sp. JB363]
MTLLEWPLYEAETMGMKSEMIAMNVITGSANRNQIVQCTGPPGACPDRWLTV